MSKHIIFNCNFRIYNEIFYLYLNISIDKTIKIWHNIIIKEQGGERMRWTEKRKAVKSENG